MVTTESSTKDTFFGLTADDVMSRDLVRLPRHMPLRDAARLLLHDQITGAPVVDADGRCVGVLSLTDIARLTAQWGVSAPLAVPLPLSCTYLKKHVAPDGEEFYTCSLPAGVCPFQTRSAQPEEKEILICSQPHSIFKAWHMVELEKLPVVEVDNYMTPDPVTVKPDTSLRAIAQRMMEAKVHRIIVADEAEHPLGIVTTMDIVAAVAYSDGEPRS
jgi:CBS domain-containing protein